VVLDTFEIGARRFFPRYWGLETEVDITERKMQFQRAALYDVGGGSQFGEMEILAVLHVTLSRPDYQSNVNMIANYSPDMTFGLKGSPISAVFGKPLIRNWEEGGGSTLSTLAGELPTLAEPVDWRNLSVNFDAPVYPTYYPTTPKRKSEAVLSGRMTISFRVVSKRVTKVEVEGLEITEITNH
jgi:hypothetical protein